MFNFLQNIGTGELLIIAAVILLFFGGKKVKGLARGLGESKKEINKLQKELTDSDSDDSQS